MRAERKNAGLVKRVRRSLCYTTPNVAAVYPLPTGEGLLVLRVGVRVVVGKVAYGHRRIMGDPLLEVGLDRD